MERVGGWGGRFVVFNVFKIKSNPSVSLYPLPPGSYCSPKEDCPGSYWKGLWGNLCWDLLFTACIIASVLTLSASLWLKRWYMTSVLFHTTWFSNKYIKIFRWTRTSCLFFSQIVNKWIKYYSPHHETPKPKELNLIPGMSRHDFNIGEGVKLFYKLFEK